MKQAFRQKLMTGKMNSKRKLNEIDFIFYVDVYV